MKRDLSIKAQPYRQTSAEQAAEKTPVEFQHKHLSQKPCDFFGINDPSFTLKVQRLYCRRQASFYHKKDLEHPGKNHVYKGGYERKEAAALTDPGDGMRRLSDISSVEVGGGG